MCMHESLLETTPRDGADRFLLKWTKEFNEER